MIAGLIVETKLLTREQIISFVNVVFENEPSVILMYPLHMASTSQFQANYLSVGIGQMRGYVENESGLIRGSDYLICILSDHKSVHKLRKKQKRRWFVYGLMERQQKMKKEKKEKPESFNIKCPYYGEEVPAIHECGDCLTKKSCYEKWEESYVMGRLLKRNPQAAQTKVA